MFSFPQADNNNLTQPLSTSVTININMPVNEIRYRGQIQESGTEVRYKD
jgi:hypothetical protein